MATNRTVTLRFRCTPEEAEQIREAADGDLSAFIRTALLGRDGEQVGQRPAKASPLTRPAGSSPAPSADEVEALAKRLYISQGIPMATARREAHRKLS